MYHPVSTRLLHNALLDQAGIKADGASLFDENAHNLPILQSYWYNNNGRTLPRYRYNQLCFVQGNDRFVLRNDVTNRFHWLHAPVAAERRVEPLFEALDKNLDPVQEVVEDQDRRAFLSKTLWEFREFSRRMPKSL